MRHALFLFAALFLLPLQPATAAQSYDNCTGFIDSVPATVSSPGYWCMRADLSSALATGALLTISAHDVVVDCNDFKLGGLAAGPGTQAVGIYGFGAANLTVRNCNLRGFSIGVQAASGTGHLVESSRFDGNRFTAIFVAAGGSMVRGNLIVDTGDPTFSAGLARAVFVTSGVDVVDNTIDGVSANNAYGVYTEGNGQGVVSQNRIRGVTPGPTGLAYGVWNETAARTVTSENTIVGTGHANSVGIRCANSYGAAFFNTVAGFNTGVQGCSQTGNYVNTN